MVQSNVKVNFTQLLKLRPICYLSAQSGLSRSRNPRDLLGAESPHTQGCRFLATCLTERAAGLRQEGPEGRWPAEADPDPALTPRAPSPRASSRRRRGQATYFHELLLRPDLNGLYLLRGLRLNSVRVEENLKAKGHREQGGRR